MNHNFSMIKYSLKKGFPSGFAVTPRAEPGSVNNMQLRYKSSNKIICLYSSYYEHARFTQSGTLIMYFFSLDLMRS